MYCEYPHLSSSTGCSQWGAQTVLALIQIFSLSPSVVNALGRFLSKSNKDAEELSLSASSQLMVAEKKGTVRFYDLVTQQAILSLDSGQMPLMSADWCLTNTIKVGAVVGSDWVIWDITRSR